MKIFVAVALLLLSACDPPPHATDKIIVVELKIMPDGTVLWNKDPVDDQKLALLFRKAAEEPKPEIRLQPDPKADYKYTAKVLRIAQAVGGLHLGFVGIDQYN